MHAAGPAVAQEKKTTVWFRRGFHKSQGASLAEVIKKIAARIRNAMLPEPVWILAIGIDERTARKRFMRCVATALPQSDQVCAAVHWPRTASSGGKP